MVGISRAIDASLANSSVFTASIFDDRWSTHRVIEFINERRNATVATVSVAGQPHAAVVLVACAGEEIYFTVHPESILLRNILDNDRIAMSVCDSVHAVMCQGRAVRVGHSTELVDLINELGSVTRGNTFTPKGWSGFVYRIELHRLVAN
ncbi:MAG: hypothetical protein B7C54_03600 [Acidimicrobiales bacterium mtb01]|nr:pyridoxamine 5'-phosphate oxidase family protein [Actinomycetota bacterium]TEX47375.1 MAG: hypothetical protein B7C54_03600 [Acidimicrobiales bacterium mtb01]